jgi:hypothetical protein
MARKLKSGIVGQAQVIFGGAIGINLGTVKNADEEVLAVGLAELKHPAAKAGDPIIDEETYNGVQVSLVFPDFDALNNFRHILDELEAELKDRIAQREAQQKIDFDDVDPNHLVHEHIQPVILNAVYRRAKQNLSAGVMIQDLQVRPGFSTIGRALSADGGITHQFFLGAVIPGGVENSLVGDHSGLVEKSKGFIRHKKGLRGDATGIHIHHILT